MERHERIRPLVVVLKLFLAHNRLGDTATGGVGSYLLFVMVHSHVVTAQLPESLGELLLSFLCEYRTTDDDLIPGQWCVLDPLKRGMNIGKKAWRAASISHAFGNLHDGLVSGELSISDITTRPLHHLNIGPSSSDGGSGATAELRPCQTFIERHLSATARLPPTATSNKRKVASPPASSKKPKGSSEPFAQDDYRMAEAAARGAAV